MQHEKLLKQKEALERVSIISGLADVLKEYDDRLAKINSKSMP